MPKLTRRALLQAAAPAVAVRAAARRPNILFLLTDDQRKDTVRALGNPLIETPHQDSLVRSGVSFHNAYCMGGFSPAVCLPSRMMMQRGRSWFAVQRMKEAVPNIADTMNRAGYLTFHLGKKGNEDSKAHLSYKINEYVGTDDTAERLEGHPAKHLADRVTGFLRQWKRDGAAQPFFMYLADGSPHDPRVAPPEFLARYDQDRIPLPPNFLPFHPFDNGEFLIRDEKLAPWPRTALEIRRHLRDYYAVVTYMDAQIGRIFGALREIGEYDNTIIAYTSDQGIAIGSHGLMGKQNLYQHSMNSALVFAGPGIPRGKTTDAFAYQFDIYPTLCELAGVGAPGSLEGRSLARVLRGDSAGARDTIFLAYRDVQRAVRQGRWKLIHYPKVNRTQLFDLESDPFETRDMAAEAAQAARVRELMSLLRQEQQRYGDTLALGSSDPAGGNITLDFFKNAG